MLQAALEARKTRVSDLVKHEYGLERNYCRSVEELTIADIDVEIGTVFNAADGTIYVAADDGEATAVWILVDDTIYTDITATGDYDLAVLVGGPGASGACEVVREQLKFGDAMTSGEIDAVVAILESQGIRVVNQPVDQ